MTPKRVDALPRARATHLAFKPVLLPAAVAAAAMAMGSAVHAAASDTVIATSPGSSTLEADTGSALVDPLISVTSGTNITGATVQVDAGWYAEDLLSCDAPADGLACSYNPDTGVLTVAGTASPADWQATLASVRLSVAPGTLGARTVVFALGSAIPFMGPDHAVGHFYEFVNPCDGGEGICGASWPEAKVQAAERQLFGLQGYLATITSVEENAFVADRLAGDGWIGASDDYREINAATDAGYADQDAAEGNWYWVTGPEAGTLLSVWSEGVASAYENWAEGEPNNYPLSNDPGLPIGEYYAQIYSSGGGHWNDLNGPASLGYVVEYGGTPGDPVLQLTASKTVVDSASQGPGLRRDGGGSALGAWTLLLIALAGSRRRCRHHGSAARLPP